MSDLVAVRIAEVDLGQGSATAGVVDDLLDDALEWNEEYKVKHGSLKNFKSISLECKICIVQNNLDQHGTVDRGNR